MQLKTALSEISGLRYMVDRLGIQSSLARHILLSTPFITGRSELQVLLDQVAEGVSALQNEEKKAVLQKAAIRLSQVKDIRGTVKNIQQGLTLNDIELFEVKSFALISEDIRELLGPEPFTGISIPCLNSVLDILDPEKARIPTFYINGRFDPALDLLRRELNKIEIRLQNGDDAGLQRTADGLRGEVDAIEDRVRQRLSEQLMPLADDISGAIAAIAATDILMAKAAQAISENLVMPDTSAEVTAYKGLFHPQLKASLEQQNKRYQPVDIRIENGTTLITGANMAGKTVLLKTLALSQTMCQYGFFVPASAAGIALVDQVMFSITDEQSELSGLSSYAAEMLKVNRIIRQARKKRPLLILIDELARTTNPAEGRAIVAAVAGFLNNCNAKAVITTHYGGLQVGCRKLRVKGFVEDVEDKPVTVHNIGDYIDYSLIEDDGSTVPQEALRIARILGVDEEIIDEAAGRLKQAGETNQ